MKQKHKKTLDDMEVGKSIEINGYDYQYVGKKIGSSSEIRGQECYVYVSQELKGELPTHGIADGFGFRSQHSN